MAHAHRKFFELITSGKSQVAEQALASIGQLYEIEREVRNLDSEQRRQIRQARARPVADALHEWMLLTRLKIGGRLRGLPSSRVGLPAGYRSGA